MKYNESMKMWSVIIIATLLFCALFYIGLDKITKWKIKSIPGVEFIDRGLTKDSRVICNGHTFAVKYHGEGNDNVYLHDIECGCGEVSSVDSALFVLYKVDK